MAAGSEHLGAALSVHKSICLHGAEINNNSNTNNDADQAARSTTQHWKLSRRITVHPFALWFCTLFLPKRQPKIFTALVL